MTIHFVIPKTKQEIEKEKLQLACEHRLWTKRCSCCNLLLESEHTANKGDEIEVIIG